MEKKGNIQFFEMEKFGAMYELAIIELPEMFEAWIARKNYGVSEFLLGCKKEQMIYGKRHVMTWDEFVDMALNYSEDVYDKASKAEYLENAIG